VHVNMWRLAISVVGLYSSGFLLLVVLHVKLAVRPVDATLNDEVDTSTTTIRTGELGLSRNVSWWAESVSLALGDVATRALGHDQLQQLYDNSVCMTSLAPDDVNISQQVLDAAAIFSQFQFTWSYDIESPP